MLTQQKPARRTRHAGGIAIVIAGACGLVLGVIGGSGVFLTSPAQAQLVGRGTGWCTDHSGRNFRCRAPALRRGGSTRRAVSLNNRGVALLHRGYRAKSLTMLAQGLNYLRRAVAIAPNYSQARANYYRGLAVYWSLKAKRASSCRDKILFFRRAMSSMHYHSAREQRRNRANYQGLLRDCKGKGNTVDNRGSGSGRGGQVKMGAVASVIGQVGLCNRGKCTKVSFGSRIHSSGTLKTGPNSRVHILFDDGTALTVGPNTQVVLDQQARTSRTISLTWGLLRYRTYWTKELFKRRRYIKTTVGRAAVRGTDFVMRINLRTRTQTIELFEGALALKLKGKRRETLLGLGIWTIKWSGRNGGPPYRISRHTVPAWGKAAALNRRRAYYNRVLPVKGVAVRKPSDMERFLGRWCMSGRPAVVLGIFSNRIVFQRPDRVATLSIVGHQTIAQRLVLTVQWRGRQRRIAFYFINNGKRLKLANFKNGRFDESPHYGVRCRR